MIKALIVTPALNESKLLPSFIEAFHGLRKGVASETSLRLLVVDDGSEDDTLKLLRTHAGQHPELIQYLSFSSNFGYQPAMIAGLSHIGNWPDVVITMDCDLEHPLEVVPKMIELWKKEKFSIVNTIRLENKALAFRKRFLSKVFYLTTARMTGLDMSSGQADFRLWDGTVLRSLIPYLVNIGAIRVFAAWLPGKKGSVEYSQAVQSGRSSRFNFSKNVEFWKTGVIRFSSFPLKVITALGALGLVFSAVYGTFILAQTLLGHTLPGWSSIVLTVIFMSCLQLISLGIVASYLRRLVFSKDLPAYVIKEKSLEGREQF